MIAGDSHTVVVSPFSPAVWLVLFLFTVDRVVGV